MIKNFFHQISRFFHQALIFLIFFVTAATLILHPLFSLKTFAADSPDDQSLQTLIDKSAKAKIPKNLNIKSCPPGQERNPVTYRCKKSIAAKEEKTCQPGYEINPSANRCIKIKAPKVNNGAPEPLIQKKSANKKVFIAGLAVLGIFALGFGYLIFQFRKEIARTFKKLKNKFSRAQSID